jgi:hypothetical protein
MIKKLLGSALFSRMISFLRAHNIAGGDIERKVFVTNLVLYKVLSASDKFLLPYSYIRRIRLCHIDNAQNNSKYSHISINNITAK